MGLLDASDLFDAIGGESPDEGIIERLRDEDSMEIPIELTDVELWANYTNDDLYEMDKKVREFLKKTRYKRDVGNGYRTSASMVFAWIYGRLPEPSDGAACRLLHVLLRYYCTSYTGRTTIKGKPVNRVYKFSRYATNSKRPYSLRLRLEEARDKSDTVFKYGTGAKPRKGPDGRRADRADGKREDG